MFNLQVISHCERRAHHDVHRFEKISNIIKQFKLSCSKLAAAFQSMEVKNSSFAAFIDIFSSNTYVMVITSDPSIRKFALLYSLLDQRIARNCNNDYCSLFPQIKPCSIKIWVYQSQ
jgi:Ras-related GTP-binding protein A/B